MPHSMIQSDEPVTGPDTEQFLADVIAGLSQEHRGLPSKYHYDARGAELFEQITRVPEYYQTRTELAIMEQYASEMAVRCGPECAIIEFGSGSSRKTRLLLQGLNNPAAVVLIDIAAQQLMESAAMMREHFDQLPVFPIAADYTQPLQLPTLPEQTRRKVIYFPGSTIGNFPAPQAHAFLLNAHEIAGDGGGLLIGIDLQKDPQIIEAAYNDKAGVTAAFNLNMLAHINRALGADFDLDNFEHRSEYNRDVGRIESYLISRTQQTVHIGDAEFEFQPGDRICTEYSYKYTIDSFSDLLQDAGFTTRDAWADAQNYFCVVYAET